MAQGGPGVPQLGRGDGRQQPGERVAGPLQLAELPLGLGDPAPEHRQGPPEVLAHPPVVLVFVVAEAVHLGQEGLGGVEVALEGGDDAAVDGHHHPVPGDAAAAEGDQGRDLVEVAGVALLDHGDPAQGGGEHLGLVVPRAAGDLAHLDGQGLALARRSLSPGGVVAGQQAEGQRLVVAAPPGQQLGGGDQVAHQLVVGRVADLPAHQPPVGLAQQLRGGRCRGVAHRLEPVDGEGHPGQQVGGVEAAGQAGRLLEQRHGLLAAAGEVERLAELESDPGPAGRILDHLEGPPEVPGRLLGGQAGAGVAGRRLQQHHPPGRFELGAGQVGVAGQAGRDQPLGQPRVLVDGQDDGGVAAAPLRLAERVVEGLPDQVVGEREPAGAGGDDQPGAGRPAEQLVHPGRRHPCAGRQHLGVELLAEHGGHAQQLRHRLGEQGQAPADGVADPGCDRRHRAVGVPQPGRLLHEEGVAAGAPVDLGDQLRIGLTTRRPGHQGAHLVAAEAGQGDRRRLGHELEQQRARGCSAGSTSTSR
jgi:hypothetical protein